MITHLSDVCDTAGVHVFEHLELALIVDDEGSGAGLLWLRVGHIVVTCLVDASRVMFKYNRRWRGQVPPVLGCGGGAEGE